jgi:hypothetical protein
MESYLDILLYVMVRVFNDPKQGWLKTVFCSVVRKLTHHEFNRLLTPNQQCKAISDVIFQSLFSIFDTVCTDCQRYVMPKINLINKKIELLVTVISKGLF